MQDDAHFRWSRKRVFAAEQLAEGQLTHEQIATVAGVRRNSITRWLRHPVFAARVAEIVEAAQKAAYEASIARKVNRINDLIDLRDRLFAVIRERAADPAMALIPGGKSGLLVRETKYVKVYAAPATPQGTAQPTRQVVEVEFYTVDNATIKSILAVEEQMAREQGEWTEKRELTGASGEPLIKAYIGVDLDLI